MGVRMPIEAMLFLLLLATAVAVARLKDLFAAAMLTGVFSLLSAGLFTLMDGVDVAFTEAAVGAGISTVLILGALSLTARVERQETVRVGPFLVVGLTGAALIYGTLDMPAYGDPGAPIHNDLTEAFIHGSQHAIHIPNIVTSVLASYRGYDTLGEVTVVFVAAVGVMLLLSGGSRGRDYADEGLEAEDVVP
jgi:multicomponent Na+:H+ antiporter subunit B